MYLLVKSSGKYWRLNYRFAGKQKTLSLGVYPAVTLADARKKRAEARVRLAVGEDPSTAKKAAAQRAQTAATNTFEVVARKWLKKSGEGRAETTQSRVVSWFERDVFPSFGDMPIAEVRPRHVLDMLEKIEARGAIDSAHRVLGYCSLVFESAMVLELINRDPTVGLISERTEKEVSHYAAITEPRKVGTLLRAIDAYEGHPFAMAALKLAPIVFVRPGELRAAEWPEFDFDDGIWCIPGKRMKMKIDHIVPLPAQAVALLLDLQKLAGSGKYVFPSIRTARACMSENTVNAALRSMGYPKEVMTGHGFRAMARTIMDEVLGERVDLIEHQLAHQVKDVNGRAYNRTAHLPARRELMQRWADYLDKLRLLA
jgi:integrase